MVKFRVANVGTPSSSALPVFPRSSRQPAPDRQTAFRKLLNQFEILVSS